MKNWKVEQTAGEQNLTQGKSREGSSSEMRYHYYFLKNVCYHLGIAQVDTKLINRKKKINYLIMNIIISRRLRGSPWPSSSILLYRPSLPVGFQGYILSRHRAVVCRF